MRRSNMAKKKSRHRRSLAFSHRKLSREWHPTKNEELTPQQVTPGSHKRVWWKCGDGHEWQVAVQHRAIRGTGCPYCVGKLVTPKTSLKAMHPSLARQWHPAKNGDLTSDQVRPGSNKNVWWKCGKGHEWQATIINRVGNGSGCPYCAGQRATPQTSLRALHPNIARQWHPTKNGKLKPQEVRPGSKKRVWWKCSDGHEWQVAVQHRAIRGTGCPYCVGKLVTPKTSLAALHPNIARQWHPQRNGGLTPQQVTAGTRKKVWWLCDREHSWQARISDRVHKGAGCPYCAGRLATSQTSLKALHPTVARQWHPTKNGELKPQQVRPGSSKKVWWKCNEGHQWRAPVCDRTINKTGCPYCVGKFVTPETSLKAMHPSLARQWHPTRNGDLTSDQVRPGSNKKVWWKCDKEHEWKATVVRRCARGDGCPCCSGRRVTPKTSLRALCPRIARQWHPTKNGELTSVQVRPGSNKRVWWKCGKGPDHEWQQTVVVRTRGSGNCPFCSGRRVSVTNSLAASKQRVWWRCPVGHVYSMAVGDRTIKGRGCPACAGL
jgi:hypothetical protein